jgi:hypothetical protein
MTLPRGHFRSEMRDEKHFSGDDWLLFCESLNWT